MNRFILGICFGSFMAFMQGYVGQIGLMPPLAMALLAAFSGGLSAWASPKLARTPAQVSFYMMGFGISIPLTVYILLHITGKSI